jgi:predicted AlkP superfamily pyrophosphatase or phosphodiesterase
MDKDHIGEFANKFDGSRDENQMWDIEEYAYDEFGFKDKGCSQRDADECSPPRS